MFGHCYNRQWNNIGHFSESKSFTIPVSSASGMFNMFNIFSPVLSFNHFTQLTRLPIYWNRTLYLASLESSWKLLLGFLGQFLVQCSSQSLRRDTLLCTFIFAITRSSPKNGSWHLLCFFSCSLAVSPFLDLQWKTANPFWLQPSSVCSHQLLLY